MNPKPLASLNHFTVPVAFFPFTRCRAACRSISFLHPALEFDDTAFPFPLRSSCSTSSRPVAYESVATPASAVSVSRMSAYHAQFAPATRPVAHPAAKNVGSGNGAELATYHEVAATCLRRLAPLRPVSNAAIRWSMAAAAPSEIRSIARWRSRFSSRLSSCSLAERLQLLLGPIEAHRRVERRFACAVRIARHRLSVH
jgi:hypothetical protein